MAKNKKKNKTYSTLKKLLTGPIKLFFGLKSFGTENIPDDRGVILCANHTSLFDVFVMSASSDVQIRYMAKKELFGIPLLGSLIRALGAFPVDRKGGDVAALRKTVSMLGEGSAVGIFPQGTRHAHKKLRETEVQHGVGLIAYRAKCDIVPVYIQTKNNHVRPFKKTKIYYGEPIPYESLGFENGGKEEYKSASELVFDRICSICESVEESNG
ncbi:MAG: 1-acyl-sn-glycerol-3-phosphate acyltransferase [Clostridia bacterium]|nr:1-acyl-sn-glycerol-3-phosphate acyltransferase [Clostridia bacterium]